MYWSYRSIDHISFTLVVQSLSSVWFFANPWTAAHQASLSSTISQVFCIHFHLIGDAIWPSHPLHPHLHPLPSIFPSIRGFSSESALHIRWPKYWCLNISPSNEYSVLISCRIDWFDLLAAQGPLKSLLQHHNTSQPSLWSNSHIHTWLLGKP